MNSELALLGAILLKPDIMDTVSDELSMEDFSNTNTKVFYSTMLSLWEKRTPIDLVTIRDSLKDDGDLQSVDIEMLVGLRDSCPFSAHYKAYVKRIQEESSARKVQREINQIQAMITEGKCGDELIAEMEKRVVDLAQHRSTGLGEPLSNIMPGVVDGIISMQREKGLPTGYWELDKLIEGLKPGTLNIIAGRPGVGKSTLAFNIAENMSRLHGISSGVFSLEMSKEMIAHNFLLMHLSFRADVVRGETLDPREHDLLVRGAKSAGQLPIYLDDQPDSGIVSIRSRARRWCRMRNLKLIIVDYMQLMHGPDERKSREQEVSYISRTLKMLATELRVPVIAISQLNRDVEQRQTQKPRLSDLRESGSIEQDADLVLLMSRDDYYGDALPYAPVDIQVAKNRTGPQGECQLMYAKSMFRFFNPKEAE